MKRALTSFQRWLLAKHDLLVAFEHGGYRHINRAITLEYQRRRALADEPCVLDPDRRRVAGHSPEAA